MSGHSKWSTIKRQKGVNDAKRGATFTKMAMAIAIATKEGGGGDQSSNFKLRLVIDNARAVNMPKDNIARAIDRGLGKGGAATLETIVYEGYTPGKVALLVEAATDNRNRTLPEVRGTLEKNGGTFVSSGAVSWMFADVGIISVAKVAPQSGVKKTFDDIFEIAVDAGADDVEDSGEVVEVYTKSVDLEKVRSALVAKGLGVTGAELTKKPTTIVKVEDAEQARKVLGLIEKLEDLDDVVKVYANFDIPEALLS